MGRRIWSAVKASTAFWVFGAISIALIIGGFFAPPTGQIDGSVLTAVGEIVAFPTLAALFTAIEKGMDVQYKHGDTQVTIGNLNSSTSEELTNEMNEYEGE